MVNHASGLFTADKHKELPLDGVHVAARIVNLVAEVQVVQFYVNDSNSLVDCVYEFPLDESAAVCGFEVELQDRLLVGEVREKEQARVEYHSAIARGETAALLEQDKPDIFCQRLGNIPPRSRVNIRVTYVGELQVDKDTGAATFVLPTSIAPRYSPCSLPVSWQRPWRDVCLGRRIDPQTQQWDGLVEHLPWTPWAYYVPQNVIDRERPGAFSVTLEVEMASPIVKIESHTHLLKGDKVSALLTDANKMVASLWNDLEPMGKDLVVNIVQEKPFEPTCQLEVAADGSGCAMLTLVPEFELDPEPVEIVFLVDCSGSMGGSKIAATVRALQVFLHSLPLSCSFNIYRFGTSFTSLFRSSAKYSQQALDNAKAYTSSLSANMGGTEMMQPLRAIFATKPIGTRQLFILTDGEVSNTEQVIEECRQNASNTRVFTVGIGDQVSRHLVQGMARAGNGTAEFIVGKDLQAGESDKIALETKLINQLKLATLPSITKIDVDWLGGAVPPLAPTTVPASQSPVSSFFPMGPGQMRSTAQLNPKATSQHAVGSGVTSTTLGDIQPKGRSNGLYQAPFLPPPLFSGSKFLMFCFFTKAQLQMFREVLVTATVPSGGELAIAVPVKQVTTSGRSIQLLGARTLIRDLTEGTSHLHWERTSYGRSAFPRFISWQQIVGDGAKKLQDRGSSWSLKATIPNHSQVKQEKIDIGTKFGIASDVTSFVAVERFRDGKEPVVRSKRDVQLQYLDHDEDTYTLSHSQHQVLDHAQAQMQALSAITPNISAMINNIDAMRDVNADYEKNLCDSISGSAMVIRRPRNVSSIGATVSSIGSSIASVFEGVWGGAAKSPDRHSAWGPSGAAVTAPPSAPVVRHSVAARSLTALIQLQVFDGSFRLSEDLSLQLGTTTAELQTKARSTGKRLLMGLPLDDQHLVEVWLAATFLKVLEAEYGRSKQVWELSAEKTRAWLGQTLKKAGCKTDIKPFIVLLVESTV